MNTYHVEPLATQHDRAAFDCGEASLNEFLHRYARQNDEKGLGRTYVALLPDNPHIYGYYTIASGTIRFDVIPEKLPRYPIPVVHLGRLAVDQAARGQGLGKALLADALTRAASIALQLGIYAIEVYALNDAAKEFYLKFGFTPLLDEEKHLYLSLKKLRQSGLI